LARGSSSKSSLLRYTAITVILVVSLIAFVPPNAPFMPEEKRFPYVTFPLLPPLLAIVLAIVTRQILPSLFAGIWIAALMVTGYNPIAATTQTLEWIVENVVDSWNATILLFDFVIGAFVGVLYASGAIHAVADALARKIRSARGSSLVGWALGLIVFFDDYTNTIVVGNTVRPLTDRTRVSRELLSYIVDSTAAPVAGLALVSTWIGYEVSLIRESFATLQQEFEKGLISAAPAVTPYAAWLASVPYRYYSILAIILVLLVVLTRRHYGPMLRAEHRVVSTGKVLRDGAQPLMPIRSVLGEVAAKRRAPAWLFVLSVLVLIVVTLIGMWVTGAGKPDWWTVPFTEALVNADSATALLWGSFTAYLVAFVGAILSRALRFSEAMDYTIKGMYLMVFANALTLFAWTIKSATDAIGTADYVVHIAMGTGVPAVVVPLIVFLACMFISFTTGTSWGTFGIMMPIAIPLAWKLALAQLGSVELAHTITFASIASVFAGSIFGDHCSPISDTTIMSSMFSACDHIDHVTTQLPYAVTAALVSMVLFALFAIGIMNPAILLPIGVALLVLTHRALNIVYAKRVGLSPVVPNYVVE